MTDHDDNSDNYIEEHIPRSKGPPIKKNNKKKSFYLTVNGTSLKATHTKGTKY